MDKRSPIWKHFTVCEDDNSKASCALCKSLISRGGVSAKNYTTSAMNNHLQYKHPDEYKAMKLTASAKLESVPRDTDTARTQPTLAEFAAKRKTWTIDSVEATRVHEAIGRMIAVDVQPYSVVEDVGFKGVVGTLEPRYVLPSRKFFSTKIIPEMYETTRARVQSEVDHAKSVCLTADTWTAQNTTQSFFSLTAHWVTDDFKRRSSVLQCQLFEGAHTGIRLANALMEMLRSWSIENKVHVMLRDSGANMVKAMCDADLAHASCFAHTLQLSLHDAILAQQSVADLMKDSRKLVGHFKHSSSATSRLHDIQKEIGLPVHQLLQDVATRWNSSYLMLNRLSEQKRAVSLYLTECSDDKTVGLTSHQWTLMARVVKLLRPFEQLTREISSADACLSVVLPAVQAILLFLQNDACDTGLKKTVEEIIAALKKRFTPLFTEPIYAVTTALDPRFKLTYTADDEQRIKVKSDVLTAALTCATPPSSSVHDDRAAGGTNDDDDACEPPRKKEKLDADVDFWVSWDSSHAQDQQSQQSDVLSLTDLAEAELAKYMAAPCQPRASDPLTWWRDNAARFPLLSVAARRYLAAPATSVPSERLFSSAGDISDDKRTCLLAENLERLVFLKANLM